MRKNAASSVNACFRSVIIGDGSLWFVFLGRVGEFAYMELLIDEKCSRGSPIDKPSNYPRQYIGRGLFI